MKEVTKIKVGQKWKQRGTNAFGIVRHINSDGTVFVTDELTDKMFVYTRQYFIDEFQLADEKPSKKQTFDKNFSQNLLFSLFVLLLVLAVFALCKYIGFDALVVFISIVVSSLVLAIWESFKS